MRVVPPELLHDVPEPVQLGVPEDPRVVLVELTDLVRVVPGGEGFELRIEIAQFGARSVAPAPRELLVRVVPVLFVEVLVAVGPGVGAAASASTAKPKETAVSREFLLLLLERLLLQFLLDSLQLSLHLGLVVTQHDGRERLRVVRVRAHLPLAQHGLEDEVVLKIPEAPVVESRSQIRKFLIRRELRALHGVDHILQLSRGGARLGPRAHRPGDHRVGDAGVLGDVHLLPGDRLDAFVRPALILNHRGSGLRGIRALVVDGPRVEAVALEVFLEVDELGVVPFLAGAAVSLPGELVLGDFAVSFLDALDVVFPRRHEHGAAALANLPEMPRVVVSLGRVEP